MKFLSDSLVLRGKNSKQGWLPPMGLIMVGSIARPGVPAANHVGPPAKTAFVGSAVLAAADARGV
jgi:hypothetical protein